MNWHCTGTRHTRRPIWMNWAAPESGLPPAIRRGADAVLRAAASLLLAYGGLLLDQSVISPRKRSRACDNVISSTGLSGCTRSAMAATARVWKRKPGSRAARNYFDKAVRTDRSCAEAYYQRGCYYMDVKNATFEAREDFESAKRKDKKHWRARSQAMRPHPRPASLFLEIVPVRCLSY